MIEPKQLKVGLLIWWIADRHFRSWDCPGVVTHVDHDNNFFRVKTFDTMEETDNLLINRPAGNDDSSLKEMRVTTPREVRKYIDSQNQQKSKRVSETQQKLKDEIEEAEEYAKKAKTLEKELEERELKEPEAILPKL